MGVSTTVNPASDDRIGSNFAAVASAAARYARARLKLLGVEGRQSAKHFAVIAGLLLGALGAVTLGYIFLVITLVFAIALVFDNPDAWVWIIGVMALLHLAVAAACIWFGVERFKQPVFSRTVEELRKDETWLHSQSKI